MRRKENNNLAKYERQINSRPVELIRTLSASLGKAGRTLIDSSSYEVGGASAHLEVWGQLSVLVIGSGGSSTVTAISSDEADTTLVEKTFDKL